MDVYSVSLKENYNFNQSYLIVAPKASVETAKLLLVKHCLYDPCQLFSPSPFPCFRCPQYCRSHYSLYCLVLSLTICVYDVKDNFAVKSTFLEVYYKKNRI